MPLDLGMPELVVILIVIMVFFGVGKLPEIGAGLGRGIREFKQSLSGHTVKLDAIPGKHDSDGPIGE